MQAPLDATACLPIGSDADLARVRRQVRQAAAALGFGLVQQTKLVTAASEVARNALVHGGGGHVEITPLGEGARRGLRLTFADAGPGIRDVERAMAGGSPGDGPGSGLSGARRLVQELTLHSRPGRGTTVTITDWLTGLPAPRTGTP
ncbi:ATP-binding protein [Streptomyces sp. NPDC051132]|uniref:ATP-binding protein n=1 Tax=unclassified Streptomyces TaxID=2593676 RepID=UPI00343647D1